MAFVNSDEWQIWYEAEGEGPPLVLCGGPIMLHDQFGRAPSLLARDFRVVNWNWRGAGRSSRNWMSGLTFDHWIDDLVRVLDAAKIDRANFWGVSWGSLFAIRFAARFPDRVGRLVLHPIMQGPTTEVSLLQAEIVRKQGLEQLIWSGFWLAGSSESFADGSIARIALHEVEVANRNLPAEILPRVNALYRDLDLTHEVTRLAAPVMLLLGASGRLGAEAPVVAAAIARFRAACPQASLVAIPAVGGTMAAVEAPETCVEAIRAFLMPEAAICPQDGRADHRHCAGRVDSPL